jgi:hypothetical protein
VWDRYIKTSKIAIPNNLEKGAQYEVETELSIVSLVWYAFILLIELFIFWSPIYTNAQDPLISGVQYRLASILPF